MKIGLIGAENSHTVGLCNAINKERKYPGYTITHVYGGDSPEACGKLVGSYGLTECGSEEDIIAVCDALVVTYRRGSLHHAAVMKALRAGKSVYNDKPFTTDLAQAREIADYAKAQGLLVCGGSTVKSLPGLAAVADKIRAGSTAIIAYPADPESPYDGFWFYGIHSVEACVKLFGPDYKSVSAFRSGKGVVSSVNYGDRRCILVNTPETKGLTVTIMNGDATETITVPQDYPYVSSDELIEMLKTGKSPFEYSFYVAATKLMADIVASAGL